MVVAMNILDLLDKDRASRVVYESWKDEAYQMFIQQKDSLKAIASTNWFREIREYWQREVELCQERLRTMKSEDIKSVQAELNLAKRFLMFLDNMLTDPIVI